MGGIVQGNISCGRRRFGSEPQAPVFSRRNGPPHQSQTSLRQSASNPSCNRNMKYSAVINKSYQWQRHSLMPAGTIDLYLSRRGTSEMAAALVPSSLHHPVAGCLGAIKEIFPPHKTCWSACIASAYICRGSVIQGHKRACVCDSGEGGM